MKIVKKQNIHSMTNQPQNDSTSVMPKETSKRALDTIHSVSDVLVWYILTKWPFYRGEDNKK